MKRSYFFMIPLFSFLFLALIQIQALALKAEAFFGEPFGVCRIELPMSNTEQKIVSQNVYDLDNIYSAASLFEFFYQASVYESKKRSLYPAWNVDAGKSGDYHNKTMLFLFHGSDELDVILAKTGFEAFREKIKIKPVKNEVRRKELIKEWWNAYIAKLEILISLDLYDPSVELGIASMMSRRLGLPMKDLTPEYNYDRKEFDHVFGLLLGTESIRLAMQTNTMLNTKDKVEIANQNLPKAVSPPPMPIPHFNESKVKVEPIAMRVPQECFYLRFGSFSAFLEARDFLDRWGTILRSTLSSRSADYAMAKRIERQLALKETALSRYFGSSVIKDVAIIGTDTFLREGAAIGILFEAKSNTLLKNQLDSLRSDVLKENPSVKESSVTINGRTISLLSSTGNEVRSFYVQDGDFHLVTTSSRIVQAFLATKTSNQSLGSLKEFRYARSQIDFSEKGIFIYMSDPFFRNLVSPAYRVEMTRRSGSIAELQMLSLARLAALQEGIASPSIQSLIEKGFLPKGFGLRPDKSRPTLEEDGAAADSKRGALGSFIPVPDVTIDKITSAEAEAYKDFANAYSGIWTNMDPVFGLLNNDKKNNGERLELKLSISPYAKSRYGNLDQFLGEPARDRVAMISGDLVSLEVQLARHLIRELFQEDEDDDEVNTKKAVKKSKPFSLRIFGALRDMDIPWSIQHGVTSGAYYSDKLEKIVNKIATYDLKFYAGITVPPNIDEEALSYSLRPETKPDAKGYVKLNEYFGPKNELWARRFDSYYIIATGRSLLETVSPKIRIEKTDHPSQISLNLGDLSKSRFGNFLHAEAYTRDRRTSAGNALLLHAYQQQLQPQDLTGALKAVQNQSLLCPLGGTFVAANQEQPDRWKSTAWSEETLYQTNKLPDTYRQVIIDEMQSMRLEFSIDPDTLKTRLEIQTKAKK
ncbi:MAG: hypothetical protein FWF73_05610 [Spirochaetes bacterium]|nr:hypothetical protein [Spirochaetota bacterium]